MCCRCWVPNPESPVLTRLDLPGAAARWEALGFSISSSQMRIGQVLCRVGASEASWGFDSADVLISEIASIASPHGVAGETAPASIAHANGAFKIDHVVLASDDPVDTTSQLESFGFVAKGERVVGDADAQRSQTFFWSGELLLELVGPAPASGAHSPRARIWGVTFVVDDLDRLKQAAGSLLGPARDAVQPGRQIATVGGDAGVGPKIAFMTPHIRGSSREK